MSLVVILVLVAILGILGLRRYADDARRGQILLALIRAESEHVETLHYQADGDISPSKLVDESATLRLALNGLLADLAPNAGWDTSLGQVRAAVTDYLDKSDTLLQLLIEGRDADAARWDIEVQHPSRDALLDVLDRATQRYDGEAEWASGVADAGSVATILVALLGIALITQYAMRAETAARLTAAEETARAKDELVSMVSHELASPTTSLVASAELLADSELAETERAELLRIMLDDGRRLARLIQDFMDVQRLGQGRLEMHPEPCDLGVLIVRSVEAAQNTTSQAVVVEVASRRLPLVLADPDRLQQAIANLLSNAAKYSSEDTTIRVSARETHAGVEVSVADEGLGIPPEALPHVFERFYRVSSEDRRSIKGTGLGLAIVAEIVEAHGGGVGVESAGLGEGARFWFTLPTVADPTRDVDAALRDSASPQPPVHDPARRPLHILVVDDDSSVGSAIVRLLRPDGHCVTTAASVQDALATLAAESFDVVLSDLCIQAGAGGYDLAEVVRQRWPHVTFVLCSGSTTIDASEARARGVRHVLRKPFQPAELRALLEGIVSESAWEQAA